MLRIRAKKGARTRNTLPTHFLLQSSRRITARRIRAFRKRRLCVFTLSPLYADDTCHDHQCNNQYKHQQIR